MREFSLYLFCTDAEEGRRALDSGLDGFVVDWEHIEKARRQSGFDTEINRATPEDLSRMRRLEPKRLLCRINGARAGVWEEEIELALSNGATDVLLPMAEGASEVDAFCRAVDGRARTGVLIEQQRAVECAAEIAKTPVEVVYVGLNDLRISRQARSIFDAMLDGTVERMRDVFRDTQFGFGGLTVIDLGSPVPCRRFLEEMVRIGGDFTFLRRSFRRDIRERDMATEVRRLHTERELLKRRDAAQIKNDQARFAKDVDRAFGGVPVTAE